MKWNKSAENNRIYVKNNNYLFYIDTSDFCFELLVFKVSNKENEFIGGLDFIDIEDAKDYADDLSKLSHENIQGKLIRLK